ncbi:MAG: sensor histidine kinase [Thermoflexales bacterium]
MTTEQRLLQRLRLQLTLTYAAAALAFIALLGGLSYGLLNFYFQTITDLALRSRMAMEFIQLGQPLPEELQRANLEWLRLSQLTQFDIEELFEDEDDDKHKGRLKDSGVQGNSLEALSNTFLLWLDEGGRYRVLPVFTPPGFIPSVEAIRAVQRGAPYDLRTVYTTRGEPVRLLTYPSRSEGLTLYFQAGRPLIEQALILRRWLIGLLIVGSGMVALAAWVSWVIAGRAIRPVQATWARQREFIANASHELRAPLTLIQLSAEVALRQDTPEDERRELLAGVTQETRHMNALISDLLLLSRADAGRLPLEIKPLALGALFDDLREAWARACAERGITLHIEPTTAVARADATHLRQALIALLDNAVRHTAAGGHITLRAAASGRRVTLSVSDTGEGIAAEHLPHVFERFYQADAAHSRKGSSGLGLSIVKALVEAMQGEVQIASQVGVGTTVTLTLPAA